MPVFMDVHLLPEDVFPEIIERAHEADVRVRGKYNVQYRGYWYNKDARTVACLVDGPSREACEAVHREAHGLVAESIIEVTPENVHAFLGQGTVAPAGYAVLSVGTPDGWSRSQSFGAAAGWNRRAMPVRRRRSSFRRRSTSRDESTASWRTASVAARPRSFPRARTSAPSDGWKEILRSEGTGC
ncbi:MAG: DUF4242 domain-containing protein [Gemmatimonadetes bacterium]|nr:DUF4242 domain-containing protein [Gemmatimonadota bacterium]